MRDECLWSRREACNQNNTGEVLLNEATAKENELLQFGVPLLTSANNEATKDSPGVDPCETLH